MTMTAQDEILIPMESVDLRPERLRWRLYYNCRDHFPFLAAVDNGTIASQIRVQWVQLRKVQQVEGHTDMGPRPDLVPRGQVLNGWIEEDLRGKRKGKPNEPTWWMEFDAIAVFGGGGVTFYGER
jgi:hypothetical protein